VVREARPIVRRSGSALNDREARSALVWTIREAFVAQVDG
jgi:hypothetical protein